jgi:hypothetical protein
MMMGRVWSSAIVPAGAKVQVPAPSAGPVRLSTPTSGVPGSAPTTSFAEVFTAAKMRPCGSPTSCLRLMWSSTELSPAVASSSLHTPSGSASSWTAKRKAPDSWSDHMTPMLRPNAMTAERSSDLIVVSTTAGRNPAVQFAPAGSECATHTLAPRV